MKTSVSFFNTYNFIITGCGRSKRPYFQFFQQATAGADMRSKRSYFFFKNQWKFCPHRKPGQIFIWLVLDNHCWSRFDSQDWKSPTDFSAGCFYWTRDQRSIKPRIKKQQAFFKSAIFRKIEDIKYWQRFAK
jgi:hypothetical protein